MRTSGTYGKPHKLCKLWENINFYWYTLCIFWNFEFFQKKFFCDFRWIYKRIWTFFWHVTNMCQFCVPHVRKSKILYETTLWYLKYGSIIWYVFVHMWHKNFQFLPSDMGIFKSCCKLACLWKIGNYREKFCNFHKHAGLQQDLKIPISEGKNWKFLCHMCTNTYQMIFPYFRYQSVVSYNIFDFWTCGTQNWHIFVTCQKKRSNPLVNLAEIAENKFFWKNSKFQNMPNVYQ